MTPSLSRSKPGKKRLPDTHLLFVLNALLALVWATVWMWRQPELLLQYFYFGKLLALTHLVTLGFLSSMMMGVLLRLSPMLLKVAPSSKRVATAQLWFFLIGSWGMISHFRLDEPTGMSWSAGLVLAAALLQLWNFRGLFDPPLSPSAKSLWAQRFVATSLVYFILAASLGVILALLKAYGFRPVGLADDYLPNVFAHAHLAGVGWVANMIFGFQLHIVPTTSMKEKAIPYRYALLQIGTLGLALAFLREWRWAFVPCAIAIALACLWQAAAPARSFLAGRTREWDMAPLFVLAVTAATGVALAFGWPEAPAARGRVQLAYGFLALFGFMVATVTTVAFKLFPIWIWKERFLEAYQRGETVPGMKDLPSRGLTRLASAATVLGTVGTALAIVASSGLGLRVSTTLLLLGVVAFVANLLRVVRHALVGASASADTEASA